MEGVMAAPSSLKRLVVLALGALLVCAVGAGQAGGRTSGVGVLSAPHRVVQGNTVTLRLAVRPAGSRCTVIVVYADGKNQKGLRAQAAKGGRATFTWRVSRFTRPGEATVYVSCGNAGVLRRSIMVIGAVIPVKIKVAKRGFTTRPMRFGGTRVSWGVLLANESKKDNAVRVNVLVNFVMADNRLIGTQTARIGEIRAGLAHALGGELQFPAAAPIERLEVTVQVEERAPATHTSPAVGSVRLVPDLYDPEFVGSVEGELANDDKRRLEYATLSAVILDAAGSIIGGSSGNAAASMPSGARQFFKLTSIAAIPVARAATAIVSVEPTYARS
jgi:hypothetical protein